MHKFKVRDQRRRWKRSWPFPDHNSTLKSRMATKSWTSILHVRCCFSMSCVKFQGQTGQNARFDPNWAFPVWLSRSSVQCWRSQGAKHLPICPQFSHSRLLGRSHLSSNPSDLRVCCSLCVSETISENVVSLFLGLTAYRYPLYCLHARDHRGHGTPLAYFILSSESTEILAQCLSALKQHAASHGILFEPRWIFTVLIIAIFNTWAWSWPLSSSTSSPFEWKLETIE